MSYLIQLFSELLKGLMLAAGFFSGMIVIVVIFYNWYKKKKSDKQYEAADLLGPFKSYLKKAHQEEWFEQIKEVESIIEKLEGGVVPVAIAFYKIKTDPEIYMESKDEGKTTIKIGKKYSVLSRIINAPYLGDPKNNK